MASEDASSSEDVYLKRKLPNLVECRRIKSRPTIESPSLIHKPVASSGFSEDSYESQDYSSFPPHDLGNSLADMEDLSDDEYDYSPLQPRDIQEFSASESGEPDEEDEDEGDGQNQNIAVSTGTPPAAVAPVTLTLTDPDLLDCPICFLPLTVPLFQCENGHMVCSSCCNKINNNVCPSCTSSIVRSRAVEKILESISISCRNITYGCDETMIYSKKHEHELMCIHEPCSCPHPGCAFMGYYKLLYLHYKCKHPGSVISFDYGSSFTVPVKLDVEFAILHEEGEKTLFVLSCGVQSIGIVSSIACVAPSSIKKGISYNLTACKGDDVVNLKSCKDSTPLLIPSEFLDSSGRHNLQVSIQKC